MGQPFLVPEQFLQKGSSIYLRWHTYSIQQVHSVANNIVLRIYSQVGEALAAQRLRHEPLQGRREREAARQLKLDSK